MIMISLVRLLFSISKINANGRKNTRERGTSKKFDKVHEFRKIREPINVSIKKILHFITDLLVERNPKSIRSTKTPSRSHLNATQT